MIVRGYRQALSSAALLSGMLLLVACVTDGVQPVDRQDAARANAELGLAYLQQGKTERAESTLLRAVELNDGIAEAHSGLGLLAMQRGEFKSAAKYYRRALALQPNDPYTKNQFGVLLCRQGDFDEALALLAEVAENNRYDTPEVAATNAGICAQTAGDWLNARRWLGRALELNAQHGPALLEMARLNLKTDDAADAGLLIEQYLRQQPRDKAALQLGLQAAESSGNAWAADLYASKLRSLEEQQPAPDGQPE